MSIMTAAERPASLLASLLEVWETSVAATHLFLTPDAISSLKPYVKIALETIPLLAYAVVSTGAPTGFLGVDTRKIEMLFISPAHRGEGLGKRFIEYACSILDARYVDVNEQNVQAVGFYEHMGFQAFKRSEVDGQGNPYPLLHMKREAPESLPDGCAVKLAAPEHIHLLNDIELAASAIFPPEAVPQSMLSETVPPSVLEEALKIGMLWVAVNAKKQPVGYALMQIIDGYALLAQMDVHPEYGRKGIGTALVRRVVSRVREDRLGALYLTTFRLIPWNAPFYSKLGFEIPDADGMPGFIQEILRDEDERGLRDRVAMRFKLSHSWKDKKL